MSIATTASRLWVNIIIAMVVLLVGHDAVMAMDAHTADSGSHHHQPVVEQSCSTIEGAIAHAPLLPTTHPPAAFISTIVVQTGKSDSICATGEDTPVADAATRRAMTQVFLN